MPLINCPNTFPYEYLLKEIMFKGREIVFLLSREKTH